MQRNARFPIPQAARSAPGRITPWRDSTGFEFRIILKSAALIPLAALFSLKGIAQKQGNADVPRSLSYEGQLTTTDGQAMNSLHHISATLYSDTHGKTSVWQGSYDVTVQNGR